MTTRSYSELMELETLEQRFEYLALHGYVGDATFGSDRWMNQQFYSSSRWKDVRQRVMIRDDACELAVPDFPIHGRIYIHHMNPMTRENLVDFDERVLDPEFLITVSLGVHNAIHYGDERHLPRPFVPRAPGDTLLWEPLGEEDDPEQPASRRVRRGPDEERPQHVSDRDARVLRRPVGRRRRRRWLL